MGFRIQRNLKPCCPGEIDSGYLSWLFYTVVLVLSSLFKFLQELSGCGSQRGCWDLSVFEIRLPCWDC